MRERILRDREFARDSEGSRLLALGIFKLRGQIVFLRLTPVTAVCELGRPESWAGMPAGRLENSCVVVVDVFQHRKKSKV